MERFVDKNNEFNTYRNLLRWSYEILLYKEQAECTEALNAINIINHCKKNKVTVNCRSHAIVLTEALLSLNFKARTIGCLPIDILPVESHVMTSVYSNSLNKWIALDSARNCIYSCENDILSISEIRNCLINGKKINYVYQNRFGKISQNYSNNIYNDEWFTDYLYKNMFRFVCNRINRVSDQSGRIAYHLAPKGYLDYNIERNIIYETEEITIRYINNE
ncbi:MAG: hypothetical protein LBI82_13900, partial [Dysgonamonadaceae bacterium]|nr:hypothetical protein [Dysgonamonadaceae bacterium]